MIIGPLQNAVRSFDIIHLIFGNNWSFRRRNAFYLFTRQNIISNSTKEEKKTEQRRTAVVVDRDEDNTSNQIHKKPKTKPIYAPVRWEDERTRQEPHEKWGNLKRTRRFYLVIRIDNTMKMMRIFFTFRLVFVVVVFFLLFTVRSLALYTHTHTLDTDIYFSFIQIMLVYQQLCWW